MSQQEKPSLTRWGISLWNSRPCELTGRILLGKELWRPVRLNGLLKLSTDLHVSSTGETMHGKQVIVVMSCALLGNGHNVAETERADEHSRESTRYKHSNTKRHSSSSYVSLV